MTQRVTSLAWDAGFDDERLHSPMRPASTCYRCLVRRDRQQGGRHQLPGAAISTTQSPGTRSRGPSGELPAIHCPEYQHGARTGRSGVAGRSGYCHSVPPGLDLHVSAQALLPWPSLPDQSAAMTHQPSAWRIVVTDDDPKLMAFLVSVLQKAGNCVFAAYDGNSACELALMLPKLHLLVTNTRLGTVSARELIRQVRAEKPELPILQASHCLTLTDYSPAYHPLPSLSPKRNCSPRLEGCWQNNALSAGGNRPSTQDSAAERADGKAS
jgi:CheY-like chemotaxis protein